MTKRRSKVVVDTGVLISAFAFGGVPASVVKKAFTGSKLFVSTALLNEYREVPLRLAAEGKIDRPQLKALIAGIAAFVTAAVLVHPEKKLRICRDPKDDIVLECCLAAKADFLITGDKDLLELEDVPFDLTILSPQMFLKT